MRIVSLLPSATEIICSIGLRRQLVGVSHECDFPASVRGLPPVTQTLINSGLGSAEIDQQVRSRLHTERALYSLRAEVLAELRPNLIVSQALCDVCAVAGAEVDAAVRMLPRSAQVVNLEPASLDDVFHTIELVGEAAGRSEQAQATIVELGRRVDAVRRRTQTIAASKRPRVAVLEWLHPLFNAGHWTPQLVEFAGGLDCLGNPFAPSTTISWQQLADSRADVIVVALCGFDVQRSLQDLALLRNNPSWQTLPAVQTGRVYVADGNAYFSRSGPRLVDSLEILAHGLHPGVHPPGAEALLAPLRKSATLVATPTLPTSARPLAQPKEDITALG